MLPELAIITESAKPMSVSELANLTGKSLPVISRNLARAKKRKIVAQLADKTYVAHSKAPDTPLVGKIDGHIIKVIMQNERNREAEIMQVNMIKLAQYLRTQADIIEAKIYYTIKTNTQLSQSKDIDMKGQLMLDSDDASEDRPESEYQPGK